MGLIKKNRKVLLIILQIHQSKQFQFQWCKRLRKENTRRHLRSLSQECLLEKSCWKSLTAPPLKKWIEFHHPKHWVSLWWKRNFHKSMCTQSYFRPLSSMFFLSSSVTACFWQQVPMGLVMGPSLALRFLKWSHQKNLLPGEILLMDVIRRIHPVSAWKKCLFVCWNLFKDFCEDGDLLCSFDFNSGIASCDNFTDVNIELWKKWKWKFLH